MRLSLARSVDVGSPRIEAEERFVTYAAGRPAARVVATVNRDLRDRDGTPVGALGFFEAEDERAGQEVLAAGAQWLRGRGLRRAWGPLNRDLWHGYRLMTRGFDRPPFAGEPRNPASHPAIFEQAGFRVRRRWNTFELGRDSVDDLLARFDDAALPAGYRIEAFADRAEGAAVEALRAALVTSFSSFLGFTPISAVEFRGLVTGGGAAVHPGASFLVCDDSGAVVAFVVVFRDPTSGSLLLHLGGITPEEARKKSGVARAGFGEALRRIRAEGAEGVFATLVARGNPVRRLYGPWAADDRREYALYEREL